MCCSGDNLEDLFYPPDQMFFFPSACYTRNKLLSFFCVCLVFPYLSSALKVGGNTEELGCDVKLQLFFLEMVCECNKKYSGGEKGGEKKKKKRSVNGAVGCFSFALWSKRTESCCTTPGERHRAVPSASASPRGAMRWLELG